MPICPLKNIHICAKCFCIKPYFLSMSQTDIINLTLISLHLQYTSSDIHLLNALVLEANNHRPVFKTDSYIHP